jgi:DivIVA domain-containing protein
MALTPEDVASKRFTPTRFKTGYDEEEVDAFLDEVETELRRLLSENADLRQELQAEHARAEQAAARAAAEPAAPTPPAAPEPEPEPAAPPEEPQEQALRTLLLAQRTADEAIAQARAEAAIVEEEAARQHAAAMVDLQRQRNSLEAAIDNLRGFEREYRTRLKAYLEGQLRDLASRPSFAPAGGPSALAGLADPPRPGVDSPLTAGIPSLAPDPARAGEAGSPPEQGSPFSPAPPLGGGSGDDDDLGGGHSFTTEVDAGTDLPFGPPGDGGGDVDDWHRDDG